MMSLKSVCVYCASSSKVDMKFFDAAQRLGKELARHQVKCVYGAGNQGLMGELADAVLSHGGEVLGIIPQFMYDEGWNHTGLTELYIVESMHIRKQMMVEYVDAAIALPGGCGTLEELLEIITWKQLGLFSKPIVILNTDGYYDHLIAMLDRAVEENFMHEKHSLIWTIVNTPEEVVEAIRAAETWINNPRSIAAL
ncbi:MAG: TIGR00730 family Rossman fold protein [Bacteroidota bacterium]|nr:TIGR00730 family Rossman fold protein [Bacteroidota bacterium]